MFLKLTYSHYRWDFYPTDEEIENVAKIFGNDFRIPLNFQQTAEAFIPRPQYNRVAVQSKQQVNPQTSELCEKLGISDPLEILIGKPVDLDVPVVNPDEIRLDEDDGAIDGGPEEGPTPESGDLFYLDTKPQRSKMSLPEPVQETKETETDVETIHPQDVLPTDNVPPKETPAEEEQPLVKKFRRRNQDIYAQPDGANESC